MGYGYFDSVYAADLPSRAVTVFMYLKNRANKDKSCFPSTATIADALSLSRRTICRALNDLEQAGFIRREARWRTKGGRSSNLYYVLDNP